MISLHPSVVSTPTPASAARWTRTVLDSGSIVEVGDRPVYSSVALARAHELDLVATLPAIRRVVDNQRVDALSLSTLIDSLLSQLVWAEELPVALDIRAWTMTIEEVATTAAPMVDAVPLLALSTSLAAGRRPKMYWVGATGVAELRSLVGTYATGDSAGSLPISIAIELLGSRRAVFQAVEVDPRRDVRRAALAVLAATCDDQCFGFHAERLRIHPEFGQSSGVIAGAAKVVETALRLGALVAHRGNRAPGRPLRTAPSSSAPMRRSRRHAGEAWRIHVTKRAAGYRLHYWMLADGSVELASLEPKTYTDIPD